MAWELGTSLVKSRRLRSALIGLVVIQLGVVAWLVYVPLISLGSSLGGEASARARQAASMDAQTCAEDGMSNDPVPTVATLRDVQVRVARAIYVTTVQVGRVARWSPAKTERASVVALSAANQESALGVYPGFDKPNADGDAGFFQQRTLPGWYGTVAQVNNPGYATRVFLLGKRITAVDTAAAQQAGKRAAGRTGYTIPGLAQIPGWENKSITEAAQAVQRSAFSDAYAKHEQLSRALVQVFKGKVAVDSPEAATLAAGAMCGAQEAMQCPAIGSGAEAGLQPDSLRVMRCIVARWPQISGWSGVGDRPANVDDDHQTGRAVDAMIPGYQTAGGKTLGESIAAWAVANRAALGVKYVIWNERIWSAARQAEGWRTCGSTRASCYNGPDDTAAHRDHVHVSTYGNVAGAADQAVSSGKIVRPVTGYVLTASFGQCSSGVWVACHTGQDFALAAGSPIRATMAGTVISVSRGGAYGNLTKIDHGGGVASWYAHQSRQSVRVGQRVGAGAVIGYVGFTGNVRPAGPAGSHLHFEIRLRGSAVDPYRWLQSKGAV